MYVRGNFPDNPGAILARAQQRHQKGGWGLTLPSEAESELNGKLSYTLGSALSQGLINYQWPYMKYELLYKGCNPGTYEICSFVKEGTLYQVSRIVPGEPSNPKKTEKQEGKNTTLPTDRRTSAAAPPDKAAKETGKEMTKEPPETAPRLKIRLGGAVRFGCICSNGEEVSRDEYSVTSFQDKLGLSCFSENYKRCLDMQLFVNGKAIDIGNEPVIDLPDPDTFVEPQDNGRSLKGKRLANTCIERTIDVSYQEKTVIMTAFSLRDGKGGKALKVPDRKEVIEYLGISRDSGKDTKRLWNSCQAQEQDSISAIARCVEVVLSVSSIPFPQEVVQIESDSDDEVVVIESDSEDEDHTNRDSERNLVTTDQMHTPDVRVAPSSEMEITIPQKRPEMEQGSTQKDKDGDANQDSEQKPATKDNMHTPDVRVFPPSETEVTIPQERPEIEQGSTQKDKDGDTNQDSEQKPATKDDMHTPDVRVFPPLETGIFTSQKTGHMEGSTQKDKDGDANQDTEQNSVTTSETQNPHVRVITPSGEGVSTSPVVTEPPQADPSILDTASKESRDTQDAPKHTDTASVLSQNSEVDEADMQSSSSETDAVRREPPIALIRNIIAPQYVYIESTL